MKNNNNNNNNSNNNKINSILQWHIHKMACYFAVFREGRVAVKYVWKKWQGWVFVRYQNLAPRNMGKELKYRELKLKICHY